MTIVAIWSEESRLWAVADTRFSAKGFTEQQTLTDHGPKIFLLPVVIREPGSAFGSVKHFTQVGFAYAGAVNPALSTHALCNAVLQNLFCAPSAQPPPLSSIANFVNTISSRYMSDWGVTNPRSARFSAFVFGYCTRARRLEAYHIEPTLEGEFKTCVSLLDTEISTSIGSGSQEFSHELDRLKTEGDKFLRKARLPLIAIENLVSNGKLSDVGGGVQIAVATATGVQFFARASPIVPGEPGAVIKFLGVDFQELNLIDGCWFSMPGLA